VRVLEYPTPRMVSADREIDAVRTDRIMRGCNAKAVEIVTKPLAGLICGAKPFCFARTNNCGG
jgi:hypothetical protein